MEYNLEPDLSRNAVFQPGSIAPFGVWDAEWLTNYSFDNISLMSWWSANLCHCSYCPEEKIKSLLKGRGEYLRSFQNQNEFAFAVVIKETLFIVFQGSTGGEDILINLSLFPIKEGDAFVHRGFQKALDILWPELEEFLLANSHKQVVYCGHSLGGAMAQLASYRIAPDAIFSFGAPRVSFDKFNKSIDVPHWRYVNCADWVPYLPPALFGYRHMGKCFFIDSEQQIRRVNSLSTRISAKVVASLRYALQGKWLEKGGNLTRSLVDHAPVNYCRALSRHLLSEELEK